jgi:hypothetical protein
MRSLRQVCAHVHFSEEATLDALGQPFATERLDAFLDTLTVKEQRLRKLPLRLVVLLCIAMNLFTDESLDGVLGKLLQGARFLRPGEAGLTATASAICQRRQHLGVAPLAQLMHELCQPLASPATPGAFLGGLRLMALDGILEEVPDSPANARTFGRHRGGRGESAFPQVRAVYLVECGTHAICDAVFLPYRTSERSGGLTLLRSVSAGMLVLWDRGFYSYALAQRCRAQGAHFLARLKSNLRLSPPHRLPDGSYLATVPAHAPGSPPLSVRILDYTLEDPARPGHGECHRLMTSLLDPVGFPAETLIEAYHGRQEIELPIDETATHQRRPQQPLRSRTPAGVLQELCGLVLAHYAIRRVMYEAAMQLPIAPTRLGFVKTVRLLRRAVFEFQLLRPAAQRQWYQRLLHEIGQTLLPLRRNRTNPRGTKHKMSKFNAKREAHRHWPQPSKSFAQAIVLLN